MDHTYKYSVLTATPDRRRGERVNVGIVVFRDGKTDVRLVQAAFKLKALTRENWESRLEAIRDRIVRLCDNGDTPEACLERLALVDPLIAPTGMGMLSAHGGSDYERTVGEILESLVLLPKPRPTDAVSRINTEIAKTFRKAKALAKPEQGLKDGKIVRFLPIAPNEGLLADFALRNGRMHIASTLDLRKQSVRLDEAALKSIVLDKSREVYGKSVRRIGVYAVEPDLKKHFSHHIELLSDYADETYNWLDQTKRNRFLRTMYDALHSHS
ncbi:DUF3037 domain-containing protein [Bradyrhizobium lablabi]|uniref:DUF3037 domain-containing protein n=1 Tax=Bradyrhizobium lablabi TaxID=722472 RepID=UPI001BA766BD|nr:DUF3037 domain-containing protein [Bradyrhizobium lablabi]MBR0693248.1 DUF3037 domain-containing protein [Bradyrhizobium lablabi]